MSGVTKTGLSKALQKRLLFCKLSVIFKSTNRLKSYFNFKFTVMLNIQIYVPKLQGFLYWENLSAFESKGFRTSRCATPNSKDC